MEKFKNFIYDKNDIVIALVIIIVATFIITGRINAIMAYPQTMLEQAQGEVASDPAAPAVTDPVAGGPDGSNAPVVSSPVVENPVVEAPSVVTPPVVPPTASNTPPATGAEIKVTLPFGSTGDAIANILISSGLIAQKSDFMSAVAAAGAEKKLKAGTFKIPAGSTPAQVVAIITK